MLNIIKYIFLSETQPLKKCLTLHGKWHLGICACPSELISGLAVVTLSAFRESLKKCLVLGIVFQFEMKQVLFRATILNKNDTKKDLRRKLQREKIRRMKPEK